MIGVNGIAEIISVYVKHGWVLRRVLLSKELEKNVGTSLAHLIGGTEVRVSDIDAAWFSRPQKIGGVPWEIRHLSEKPYAILENIDDSSGDFEDTLQSVESRLRETLLSGKSA